MSTMIVPASTQPMGHPQAEFVGEQVRITVQASPRDFWDDTERAQREELQPGIYLAHAGKNDGGMTVYKLVIDDHTLFHESAEEAVEAVNEECGEEFEIHWHKDRSDLPGKATNNG